MGQDDRWERATGSSGDGPEPGTGLPPSVVGGVVGRRVVSPTLIGRAEELALLGSAVSSPPAVVVVEGEAGIGKTRLVSELRSRPELAAGRFLVGSCPRIREPFPLAPLVEAVRGLGEALAAVALSPVAGALRPLLPEVAHLLPPPPGPLDDRAGERHRVFRGLVEVLGAVSPAVLVVEDLHWVDELTADFVSYLLGDPPPGLSLVLTFRGEEAAPEVRVLTAKLPASISRAHIRLPPLGEQETGDLAAAVLGIDQVSEEFAAYLCERASGVPFAVEELLALLRARGTLVRRGGNWARRALAELDVPAGIRDPVLERVRRMSEAAQAVLEAGAVLQTRVPAPVLVATCRVSRSRALRGLAEALESGLFTEPAAAVGFRHVLAAQAVYEATPRLRRQDLHSRAAAALRGWRPVPLGQVAHHLRHAGRTGEWVEAAEAAADQAVTLGHDDEATRLLEDVLRHARLDPATRGRLAVKLGRAAVETVHAGEVIPLLSELLAQDLSRSERGELRFLLAVALNQSGEDIPRQNQLVREAVDDLDDRPDLKAWAMAVLGIPTAPGVPLAEHRQWLDRSVELLPTVQDPVVEVFVLGKVAMVLTALGDRRWHGLVDRYVAKTGRAPRHRDEIGAYCSVGVEAAYAGHHATADHLLSTASEAPATHELPRLGLQVRSGRVLLDYFRGSWRGLSDEVGSLVDGLADYARDRIDVELVAGCLALAQGRPAGGARERLEAVVELAERLGGLQALPVATAALARLAGSRGDVDGAVAAVHRLLAAIGDQPIWVPVARALPAAAHALVAADRAGEARSLVTRCARELRDLDAPLAVAVLPHARGHLAAAAGRRSAAAGQFRTAADGYERLRCPYEAAQAREQAASALLGAEDGAETDGGDLVQAALVAYQQLGAAWDYSRAAGLARQHGISVPARHRGGHRGYGTSLSPREREVVELVVDGRANKEIAAALFISIKTVETHVAAAMRKLGAPSRSGIAQRLSAATRVTRPRVGVFPDS